MTDTAKNILLSAAEGYEKAIEAEEKEVLRLKEALANLTSKCAQKKLELADIKLTLSALNEAS